MGISDADRLVRRHEHDGLEFDGILLDAFLVNDDRLMTRDLVDDGIIIQMRQITISLNGDQWCIFERCRRKGISLTQFFGIEVGNIPCEQLLDDVKNGRLAGAGIPTDHKEFVGPLDVLTIDQHTYTPLEFATLIGSVDC